MPIEVESPEQVGYANIRCNLAESSVSDVRLDDLDLDIGNLVLAYGDHQGKPGLRELVAAKYPGITTEDVLITAGAANALFIVASCLLKQNDRAVIQFPNYTSNIETPLALGSKVVQAEVLFENNFRLDLPLLRQLVTNETRLISITAPHNPTGAVITEEDLRALIEIAESHNCILLVDETYRDLSFNDPPALAASLSDNCVSISSLSKAYGLPGIRIGWIVSKNNQLMNDFLAAKEQITLTNSVLDEEVATRFLMRENTWLAKTKAAAFEKFRILEAWMNKHEYLEYVKPGGGVICFPRFRGDVNINPSEFYHVLLEEYKTMVGPGHWFGMDNRYMRIGYGWPDDVELKEGLGNIDRAIERCRMR